MLHSASSRPFRGALLCTGVLALATLAAAPAQALQFTLDTEFDAGLVGPHVTVDVTASGGGLDFVISLAGTDLGPHADLQHFYFNLVGDPTNVTLSSSQVVNTAFVLAAHPFVAGGAGAHFDFVVKLGNGAGPPGNGVIKTASFRIEADQPLTLASLLELSQTNQGILANAGARVQGTSLVPGVRAETVGGVIPEPGTLLLLGAGLAGLVATRRATRR